MLFNKRTGSYVKKCLLKDETLVFTLSRRANGDGGEERPVACIEVNTDNAKDLVTWMMALNIYERTEP